MKDVLKIIQLLLTPKCNILLRAGEKMQKYIFRKQKIYFNHHLKEKTNLMSSEGASSDFQSVFWQA